MANIRVDDTVFKAFMEVIINSLIRDFGKQCKVGNSYFLLLETSKRPLDAAIALRRRFFFSRRPGRAVLAIVVK